MDARIKSMLMGGSKAKGCKPSLDSSKFSGRPFCNKFATITHHRIYDFLVLMKKTPRDDISGMMDAPFSFLSTGTGPRWELGAQDSR
jgi:hypothetical protein